LYTSDPAVNETRLRLSGRITEPGDTANKLLEIDPFGLHAIVDQERKEYKIPIKNISDKSLNLELISTNPTYFTVNVPNKEIKPGKSRDIKVKLIDPKSHGTVGFEKSFTIELSDSAKTKYTIPVKYAKVGPPPSSKMANRKAAPSRSAVKPTGLKTKTGNNIDLVKAGTKSE